MSTHKTTCFQTCQEYGLSPLCEQFSQRLYFKIYSDRSIRWSQNFLFVLHVLQLVKKHIACIVSGVAYHITPPRKIFRAHSYTFTPDIFFHTKYNILTTCYIFRCMKRTFFIPKFDVKTCLRPIQWKVIIKLIKIISEGIKQNGKISKLK